MTGQTNVGGVRLVTGEPGCGRTWFLDRAARAFTAGPVVRVRADPARSAVPGGGLRTLLRALDGVAGREHSARAAASAGALVDALRAAAPLLVCVDDAHLWDAVSRAALGRAAARLRDAPDVALLLTVPEHRFPTPEFAGLPTLRLDPLSPTDAAALLERVTGGAIDAGVRDDVVDAAEGNPALLLAVVRRLSPAQLRGERPLPRPPADGEVLRDVVGGHLTGPTTPEQDDVLLTVAAAVRDAGEEGVEPGLVLRAVERLRGDGPGSARCSEPPPELLAVVDGKARFRSELLRRALYAGASDERRRAAHRALARTLAETEGGSLRALLHHAWSTDGSAWPSNTPAHARSSPAHDRSSPPHARSSPAHDLASELCAAAADSAAPRTLRCAALTRAAELTGDGPRRAERYTAAAEQALLGGRAHRALRLLDAARTGTAPAALRGRAELLRGTTVLYDGPVDEAQAALLFAASLLTVDAPGAAHTATLAAFDAAWAAGDPTACLRALERPEEMSRNTAIGDYRRGLRALLEGDFVRAAESLRRVVECVEEVDEPEAGLRAAGAALMLGDLVAARRAGARALVAARAGDAVTVVPRAREYLAYVELRAGRHALARTHAEEGLRAALRAGQRNTAAHHHAVLALAASIEGDARLVDGHVAAALSTARRHGLAQTATLAEWAAARADLGRGRPREAAARLGPLVRPGPRRGHFAVWTLAVPCFVEAAVAAGRADGPRKAVDEVTREVVDEFARWAAFGADPQAPAQLLRCQALLAPPERTDALYRQALDLHDTVGGDFERARTELLHGKWLRRGRRLREARERLAAALVGFERCGARAWTEQTRAELRANGVAADPPHDGDGARGAHGMDGALTPQQLRIARRVAEGATNREVALALSVSTRTVDYHLRKVFAALGVRSRVELARLVEQARLGGRAEKSGAHL
ncbi:LuxR C-terminal-related transcriptional regulator [Streptomyces sp. NPDC002328]|uniref:LuxR C-terminal-related transcriptional regulator n=1 Tax=Streptomyces sp. NPDC002328 TaxID=3364642 RepID=UPI0036BEB35C